MTDHATSGAPGQNAPTQSPPTQGTPTQSPVVRRVFRTFAFAEALSWAALLVTMVFKWIVQDDPHSGLEGGVPIAGPIHGALFVAYCVSALVAWRTYRWSLRTLVLALLASVPPFFTVLFEVRADRRGLLGRPARTPAQP